MVTHEHLLAICSRRQYFNTSVGHHAAVGQRGVKDQGAGKGRFNPGQNSYRGCPDYAG